MRQCCGREAFVVTQQCARLVGCRVVRRKFRAVHKREHLARLYIQAQRRLPEMVKVVIGGRWSVFIRVGCVRGCAQETRQRATRHQRRRRSTYHRRRPCMAHHPRASEDTRPSFARRYTSVHSLPITQQASDKILPRRSTPERGCMHTSPSAAEPFSRAARSPAFPTMSVAEPYVWRVAQTNHAEFPLHNQRAPPGPMMMPRTVGVRRHGRTNRSFEPTAH